MVGGRTTVMLGTRVPTEHAQLLEAYAELNGTTLSAVVREAVERFVNDECARARIAADGPEDDGGASWTQGLLLVVPPGDSRSS